MKCIFGIDIGGTDVKIGKFYDGKLIKKISIKTNRKDKGKYILEDIFNTIDELKNDDTIVGMSLGIPGPVVNGVALAAHNLGWGKIDIKQVVLDRYPNIAVGVLNDANAATLGEKAYGGGRKYDSFVFVTLGTGIGGGIVINGDIIVGKNGSAGEIGHFPVSSEHHRKCSCGLWDCVEQYSSATGIIKTAHVFRIGRETPLNDFDFTCEDIFKLAKEGDIVANEVIDDAITKLAMMFSSLAEAINPEAFVIGGGVSKAGEFLRNKIEKRFKELAFFSVVDTDFVLAELGNEAGIYGNCYMTRKLLNEN